ncbi:MAG TPA: hypothetical protein VFU13_01195, partial [Steroidobacteraceae bacterium]|nr:hypothetical protein [Steroidobacteraceae bacterium]
GGDHSRTVFAVENKDKFKPNKDLGGQAPPGTGLERDRWRAAMTPLLSHHAGVHRPSSNSGAHEGIVLLRSQTTPT